MLVLFCLLCCTALCCPKFLYVCPLKIKVPHPSHPSTRVSVQVPTLGIHFSPARYCRLMDLVNIICGTKQNDTQPVAQPVVESSQQIFVPWNPPDLANEARVVVWKVYALYSLSLLPKWACWIFSLFFLFLFNLYIYIFHSGNWLYCCCMAALFSCLIWIISLCVGVWSVPELSTMLKVFLVLPFYFSVCNCFSSNVENSVNLRQSYHLQRQLILQHYLHVIKHVHTVK